MDYCYVVQPSQLLLSGIVGVQGIRNFPMDIHVMVNWQLSKRVSADRYQMNVSPAQDLIEVKNF